MDEDLPAIEEKVLAIITPVAISGNIKVLESEVSFDLSNSNASIELENTSNANTEYDIIINENIPKQEDYIIIPKSYSNEPENEPKPLANTSDFVSALLFYDDSTQ